ncbi:cupin domain-containing protein [Pseudomonas sp. GX19020]|uniref:helix-turn-helix domain-containing protein n=1 Tax=Pseudomonas sp. GX19020 TaxID=2942277 RepID=UPI0020197E90|nr:cupin domain-containing protein [Pseudomonas sp. GX19020]MCL4067816.1 cupin domain-containing protein [Pseudomonas sp. GX19020]
MKPDEPRLKAAPAAEGRILGERLRELRKRRKQTLAQLADGAGLSIGYLSQIERDLAEPSINALVSIAQHLGVTVQWFFAGDEQPVPEAEQGYVIRQANRLQVAYQGGAVDELLTPRLSMALEMIRSRLPPGAEAQDAYSHDGDEVGLVLSGQLELWVGDRHFRLEAGDSFSFASSEPHRYRNPGPAETEVIWAISPPTY